MDYLLIIGIAIGLAMDAFAVSVASGCIICQVNIKNILKISITFGLFQAIMPLLGWYSAIHIQEYFKVYTHWIAFSLLSLIGIKMIYESFKIKEKDSNPNTLNLKWLFILGVATSVDALVF